MKLSDQIQYEQIAPEYAPAVADLEAENERLREQNANFEFALKLLVEELNAIKEEADVKDD